MYLPGCAAATAHPAEARAVHALLSAAGYRVETLGAQDSCCGAPLFELGLEDEANFMRESLRSKLGQASHVIASGLECAQQWRREGAASTLFADWLLESLRQRRLTLIPRATLPRVHVLDSCQARSDKSPGGVLRAVLNELGVECLANAQAARYVVCCGAAGGMPMIEPASAMRMASARIAEQPAQATAIVGTDSRCIAHLKQANRAGLAIYSLAEFVHQVFRVT